MIKNNELQVIILCGGKGERLKPLTETIPKPLVCINDRPILSYIVQHLNQYSLRNIIFATGYKAEMIDEFVRQEQFPGSFQTINSGDVDIIERIKDARKYLKSDFLVLYGDTISNVNVDDLINFHQKTKRGNVTMTLWPLRSTFGVLEIDNSGLVTSYQEKPVLDKWINIGYFYFDYKVLDLIDHFNSFEEFIKSLVKNSDLNGFCHDGLHITVNTQKELQEAEENIDSVVQFKD